MFQLKLFFYERCFLSRVNFFRKLENGNVLALYQAYAFYTSLSPLLNSKNQVFQV